MTGTVSSKWTKGSGGPAGDETYNMVAHGTPVAFDSKASAPLAREDGAAPTLKAMPRAASHPNAGRQLAVAHALRAVGFDASEHGAGRGTPLVPVEHPIAIQERAVSENPENGPDGAGCRDDGAAYTLEARTTPQAVAFDTTQLTSKTNRSNPKPGDPCHPLAAGGHPPAIAFDAQAGGQTGLAIGDGVAGALHGGGKHGGRSAVAFDLRGREGGAVPEGPHETANMRAASGGSSRSYVATRWMVRRLTPLECERLQGFPDGFTDVPYRGRNATPDGPRYKALGNSMAINAMGWIGERIEHVRAILAELEAEGRRDG